MQLGVEMAADIAVEGVKDLPKENDVKTDAKSSLEIYMSMMEPLVVVKRR